MTIKMKKFFKKDFCTKKSSSAYAQKTKKGFFEKRAAMEMSMGTIVTIVLLLSVLILGLIFVRNIMCSGIVLTDKITAGVENEIEGLFGARDYGVKCMGQEGKKIKLADGGSRAIGCLIKTNENTKYKLEVINIESLKENSVRTEIVEKWVLDDSPWEGNVPPSDGKLVTVLLLDIPQKVSATTLKIEIEATNLDSGTTETIRSYIDVEHVGSISAAVC